MKDKTFFAVNKNEHKLINSELNSVSTDGLNLYNRLEYNFLFKKKKCAYFWDQNEKKKKVLSD